MLCSVDTPTSRLRVDGTSAALLGEKRVSSGLSLCLGASGAVVISAHEGSTRTIVEMSVDELKALVKIGGGGAILKCEQTVEREAVSVEGRVKPQGVAGTDTGCMPSRWKRASCGVSGESGRSCNAFLCCSSHARTSPTRYAM
jgi:hypothetical protein